MTAPVPPGEGQLVAVDHEGSVVAVAMLDGDLYAFDDTCPHAGCSLADGELDGRSVVCPCHLAAFDVATGAVVDGPASSGVATWSVSVADGSLVLDGARDPGPAAQAPEPPADGGSAPSARPETDVTVLVEREHDAMRRQFRTIDSLTDPRELAAAWTALAELMEVHASGEESLLYPGLAREADDAGVEEAQHAVRDHNEIRDGVRAVGQHPVGSDDWWQAVRRAREVNEEHLAEEERDALPLFRESTDQARREELGREWVTFVEQHQHARGLSGDDVDPAAVVEDGVRGG